MIDCSGSYQSSTEKIDMIDFSSYGFSFETGKIFEVKNKIGIAYYKGYILFKTTVITSKVQDTSMNTNIYLNDTTGTKSNMYFFFKEGEKDGLMLNLNNKWNPIKYDNFLNANGLDFGNYEFFKLELGKPDQVQINPKTKEIEIEKFANKLKGEGEPDSLYRYYNKNLSKVNFSFNPKFDKRAKSKLYKIGLIHYSTPKSKGKSPDGKRRESFWKIEKSNSNDSVVYLGLFKRFLLERNRTK